jgi:phosphomannomutase
LVASLQKDFGEHYYGRRDMHISEDVKQSAIRSASSDATTRLGPYKILRKESMDGIKFFLDVPESDPKAAEPWVLFRASGTELLLRVYVEAASPQLVADILAVAESFVQRP